MFSLSFDIFNPKYQNEEGKRKRWRGLEEFRLEELKEYQSSSEQDETYNKNKVLNDILTVSNVDVLFNLNTNVAFMLNSY